MGLDVYVGTFTRYYQREWETIVQQSFPGQVQIVRANDAARASHQEIQEAVAAWARGLASSLSLSSIGSEDTALPYFTDKPAWDGYGGLILQAAYADQGLDTACRQEAITTDNWDKDPALNRYADLSVETLYPQLLLGGEIWLPISSPSVFRSVDAAGNQRVFGNCGKLLNELDQLNAQTWRADIATRDGWHRQGLDHGSSLEVAAKFGWSVMHRLATEAVRHNLAIILDY
ncbi:MAG: hypothetical protein K2Y21_04445 [Phycisphaerales bacterium]|nr:hypothetical protein [Phycisphaerales bacterium]